MRGMVSLIGSASVPSDLFRVGACQKSCLECCPHRRNSPPARRGDREIVPVRGGRADRRDGRRPARVARSARSPTSLDLRRRRRPPLLVLTSGAHRVGHGPGGLTGRGREVRRATPEFVREPTGHPIGGVAPIGHPAPVRTLVDTWLGKHPVVWAAAGHPHTVFPTTFDELVALTGGTPADVA